MTIKHLQTVDKLLDQPVCFEAGDWLGHTKPKTSQQALWKSCRKGTWMAWFLFKIRMTHAAQEAWSKVNRDGFPPEGMSMFIDLRGNGAELDQRYADEIRKRVKWPEVQKAMRTRARLLVQLNKEN